MRKISLKFLSRCIFLVGCLFLLVCFSFIAIMSFKDLQFTVSCSRYVERATRTNDVEVAIYNLDKAISFAEANGYTAGNTSILLNDPDNDIEYWYQNLVTARDELIKVRECASVEQSNLLIKTKESLTYNDSNGTARAPADIGIYPNAVFWYGSTVISLIIAVIMFVLYDKLDTYILYHY